MEKAPIGVAVLKMVNAKSAGVVLTVFTHHRGHLQGCRGGQLGWVKAWSAEKSPATTFFVDKESLDIESTISQKTKMVVLSKLGNRDGGRAPGHAEQSCVCNDEILEIVRVSLDVEKYFNTPQDMDGVVDLDLPSQNIFWSRRGPRSSPRKSKTIAEYIAELMTRVFKS